MGDEREYGGARGSHNHERLWWDLDKARETFAKAVADRKERHQAVLGERKAKREAAKAVLRQEGDFIGPPNPYLFRKGRPRMTVTKG